MSAADQTTDSRNVRPAIWLFLSALLSPFAVRLLLLAEFGLRPRLGDLRGLGLDLLVSMVTAVTTWSLLRCGAWGRIAGTGLLVAWSVVNFANYEHVRELGSTVRLTYVNYVADPVFLLGSALTSSHPLLLLGIIVVCIAVMLKTPQQMIWPRPVITLVVAIIAIIALVLLPSDAMMAEWRTSNVVLAQTNSLFSSLVSQKAATPSGRQHAASDLSGSALVGASPEARNVLLVILEGVSGAYLPILRERHGATSEITMTRLDAIARQGMAWATFISHQRQTNRGEYALLCGDYPKLGPGEPKMTELIGSEELDCLPNLLRNHGFSTAYLQAAPMSFMMKDQFMPLAGFDVALGDTFFDWSYRRNHWGVDDKAFFEQSLSAIEDLQKQGAPWFLTLLTVGTHHPFNIPVDYECGFEPGSVAWAMDYLDQSVAEFIHNLEVMGVSSNTLVLITSDESREQRPHLGDAASVIAQAWGFLVALTPTGEIAIIDEPFMQRDLPLSVLDYFDLGESSASPGGRSVFRSYVEGRDLFWGNTHFRVSAGVSVAGQLAICDWGFNHCVGARLGDHSLFSPEIAFEGIDPLEVNWLREGVEASAETFHTTSAVRDIDLLSPGTTQLNVETPLQFLFAGQFLSFPARSRVEVEIELQLRGPPDGSVRFGHDLILGRRQVYLRTGRVGTGEVVILHYSLVNETAFDEVELRAWVESVSHPGMEIETKTARIRVVADADSDARPGFTEHKLLLGNGPT
jgi:hypothetical protein